MSVKSNNNCVGEAHTPKNTLVVCAFQGTEDKINKIWSRAIDEPFTLEVVESNYQLPDLLASIVANENISDDFILVLPNTIPCSKVSLSLLSIPVVYIDKNRKKLFDEKLPIVANKKELVELLADNSLSESILVKELLIRGNRPLEVGFSFGNYMTQVRRANPCEHIVLEALAYKQFIIASVEGFIAIEELLDKYLG